MTKTRNRWIGLVFISMAISLVIIDGTIVNTIFPAIIADLQLTSTEVQWVQEIYVLVFASMLLIWLQDGRRERVHRGCKNYGMGCCRILGARIDLNFQPKFASQRVV